MSKQLIFLMGIPSSGKTTFINKKYPDAVCVDANDFPNLYTGTKLSNDSIEKSRLWCLERVRENMCGPQTNNESKQLEQEEQAEQVGQGEQAEQDKIEFTPAEKIVLVLIACRPERWREFIELAIQNDYTISFKFPSNKLLYYNTQHSNMLEQSKYIESKILSRYPLDRKEVKKSMDSKTDGKTTEIELNESSLFKYIVTEFQSSQAFYYENKSSLGDNKNKWLEKINSQYRNVIANENKKIQRKVEKESNRVERESNRVERESKV